MKTFLSRSLCAFVLLLTGASLSSAATVTARYFRFTQTQLRGTTATSIQISEFDMLFQGNRIAGAIATNPGGNNPATELPANAVDQSTATKWLDRNKGPLVLDFAAPVTTDSYRFATANDRNERDPVSWILESSDDGTSWTAVETRSDYPTPLDRQTYTPAISFQEVLPLQIVNFTTTRPKIGTGESSSLSWHVVGSTSVSVAPGVGAVAEISSATVSPTAAETTYTLTAVKGAETATKQVTVRVIADGPQSFRFFRFTPTLLRSTAANSVQLAEFELLLNGTAAAGAAATNPGGDNPVGETADLAVDGNLLTKWLDRAKGALVLDFGADITADAYRFATANDSDDRDPIDWKLEGSPDGNSWTLLDTVTGFPTPGARQTYIGDVPLPADIPPAVLTFTAEPAHLLPGESTTLTWDTARAQTVQIVPAVAGGNTTSGSVLLTPAASETWTLTAGNPAGTATGTAAVHVEGPARQVTWQYFRFTPVTLRNGTAANSVQISEFELSLNGVPHAGAIATNPGGNNPAGETPELAVDLDPFTKWLDYNRAPLVLEFPAPVTIDSYRIGTANDAPERDPVAWTLEGSADGQTWTLIDTRDLALAIPVLRQSYSNFFRFAGAAGKEFVPVTAVSYDKAGQSVTLTWTSEAGRTYLIERSASLDAWETAQDNVSSAGVATTRTLGTAGLGKVFFRVSRKPL